MSKRNTYIISILLIIAAVGLAVVCLRGNIGKTKSYYKEQIYYITADSIDGDGSPYMSYWVKFYNSKDPDVVEYIVMTKFINTKYNVTPAPVDNYDQTGSGKISLDTYNRITSVYGSIMPYNRVTDHRWADIANMLEENQPETDIIQILNDIDAEQGVKQHANETEQFIGNIDEIDEKPIVPFEEDAYISIQEEPDYLNSEGVYRNTFTDKDGNTYDCTCDSANSMITVTHQSITSSAFIQNKNIYSHIMDIIFFDNDFLEECAIDYGYDQNYVDIEKWKGELLLAFSKEEDEIMDNGKKWGDYAFKILVEMEDMVKERKEKTSLDPPPVPEKPVIYLYNYDGTVNVRVDFPKGGGFSCTYPEYKTNGWDVIAKPDGHLTNENGNIYRYLYWEGTSDFPQMPINEGFCVPGKDTAKFLEEKLSILGLNDDEINEFIIYWLPQMEDNPYNVITFQGSDYTESAKLTVTPEPDSVIRVFMTWYPSNTIVDISQQELITPQRNGKTVVEWGGSKITK